MTWQDELMVYLRGKYSNREVFRVLSLLTYSVVATHLFRSAMPMDSMGPNDWRTTHAFAYFPVVGFSASASFMSKFVASL